MYNKHNPTNFQDVIKQRQQKRKQEKQKIYIPKHENMRTLSIEQPRQFEQERLIFDYKPRLEWANDVLEAKRHNLDYFKQMIDQNPGKARKMKNAHKLPSLSNSIQEVSEERSIVFETPQNCKTPWDDPNNLSVQSYYLKKNP